MLQEKQEKQQEITITGSQMAEILRQEKIRARELSGQMNQMREIINEINDSIRAVKAVEGKKDLQIMVPLGAGVSLDAKVENTEKIRATLPGNIVIEKTPKEAIETLESQASAVKGKIELLKSELLQTSGKIKEFSRVMRLGQQQVSRHESQSK